MKLIRVMVMSVVGLMAFPAVQAADVHDSHTSVDASSSVQGTGVVKRIDLGTGRITLSHDPIRSLGWSSMTMPFDVKDKSLLTGLKAGDKVSFTLENKDTITAIQKRK